MPLTATPYPRPVPALSPLPVAQALVGVNEPLDWQKLEEANTLLRAITILLCNQNDVQLDDVLTLAGSRGSVLGLNS